MKNSIVWGNGGQSESDQLSYASQAIVQVEHSCIQGLSQFEGNSNIGADPQFVDAPAGDFRLLPSSPTVNAGSLTAPTIPLDEFDIDQDGNTQEYTPDLDFNPRVVYGALDMGAFELQCDHGECPGDFNDDNDINVLDLLILLENWGACSNPGDCPADLNCDGVVNVLDLLILLESWGENVCVTGVQEIAPETIEDCYERYPENTQEFIACIEMIEEIEIFNSGGGD